MSTYRSDQQYAHDGSTPRAADDDVTHPLALSEAEQVIEALNEAIALEEGPAQKARHLLRRLQELLGGDADVELVLQTELRRRPAPMIIERIFVGPTFDRIEPRPHSALQDVLDESEPAMRLMIPDALSNLRTPRTFLISEEIPDRAWFERIREKYLLRNGWVDVLLGHWAASEDRMVTLAAPQRQEQPAWGAEARRLVSLMLRAIAPIVDREMFESIEPAPAGGGQTLLEGKDLSGRQTDVLHLLLRGMSEKEVARELGVSTHTVHTHVKKLYAQFGVSSRGELLAKFVDQRVLKMTA